MARLDDFYGDRRLSLFAGDFRKHDRFYDHVAVCEDSRLSVSAIGQPFTGFLLDAKKILSLNEVQLGIWLDVLTSFLIIDRPTTPAATKEYWAMCERVEKMDISKRVNEGGDLAALAESVAYCVGPASDLVPNE